jgi:hypothetical protein
MPNRREFLQTGAVVSAIAANGAVTRFAEAIGAAGSAAPGRALYDDRYAEGGRFAAAMRARGVVATALEGGDVTRCYLELEQGWRYGSGYAVAGLTQFGPMFVVERLALERGMRMALRIEHGAASAGSLVHRLEGPAATLKLAAEFGSMQSDWPALMAMLASHAAADDSPPQRAELSSPQPKLPTLAPATGEPPLIHYYTPQAEQQGYGRAVDGNLYSWVVVPRAKRA